MQTETRSIESFDKINFKDFGTLILTQGDQESLTVEADEELMPELITEVRSGKLVLGIKDDWLNRIGKVISSIFNREEHKVTYTVTCVDLERISMSGHCILTCESLEVDEISLHVSGFSDMRFKHLACESLAVHISGRGEFEAAGIAHNQQLHISGSGDYKAPNLDSNTAKVVISGQGDATLRVQENLDITVSGVGRVNYYGRPKLRQVISGIGKSKRLNDE